MKNIIFSFILFGFLSSCKKGNTETKTSSDSSVVKTEVPKDTVKVEEKQENPFEKAIKNHKRFEKIEDLMAVLKPFTISDGFGGSAQKDISKVSKKLEKADLEAIKIRQEGNSSISAFGYYITKSGYYFLVYRLNEPKIIWGALFDNEGGTKPKNQLLLINNTVSISNLKDTGKLVVTSSTPGGDEETIEESGTFSEIGY